MVVSKPQSGHSYVSKPRIDGTTEDSIENILISHITHSIVIVKLSNIIDIIKKNIIKRFFSILSYIRR